MGALILLGYFEDLVMGTARLVAAFLFVFVSFSLAGCGQKGPLKLPNKSTSHLDTIHLSAFRYTHV